MTVLTNKRFWIRSAERAIKTFAQTLLVVLGDSSTVDLLDASFLDALAVAASATFLSFLTSIASTLKGDSDSPSLVDNVIEEEVIEKIEQGEPVGDPERVIVPADEIVVDQEFLEPVGLLEPEKPKRKPRKKVQ